MKPKRIAHRANLNGPDPSRENTLDAAEDCINKGYDVEIDLWYQDRTLSLGHNEPEWAIPYSFLADNRCWLWIHCKELSSLQYMTDVKDAGLNFFWHQGDDYTLTSKGHIWTYPGKKLCNRSVAVCPDRVPDWNIPTDVYGICSDYISTFEIT